MLFDSSFRQELARYFWATLVVLTIIVITVWLIRTFGEASLGRFNPQDVGMVLGYTAMSNLHSLLTLSLYIALVATVSRMYADSEMVIWQASGQSVLSLLAPALRFAWPWLITITALSLMAWPWSNMQIREMRERYEKRDDLQRIKPGQFQESADGKRVFFIDNSSIAEKTGNRIFVVSNENNTQSIVTAQTGVIETRDRDRFFILSNGIPFINPRSGRSGSLIVTVISFFTYYNLVNMSKYWVAGGKISLPVMLVTLHLPVLLVSLFVLFWRQQQGLGFAKPRKPLVLSPASA